MTRPKPPPVLHPCHGLSARIVETFERIAINLPPQAALRTIEALARRGLIERTEFGDGSRNYWFVPTPVHHDWCVWCAVNAPDDRDERDERSG
jgi:hypothetical protein